MLTSRTARWVAGTALLCVAVLTVSWLLLVSPRRAEAAELHDQNVATQTQNDLLEVKIAQLRSQFARLPESQAELADILAQMPADAGVPRLVRDLDTMATDTGVELTSLTPGAAQSLVIDTAPAAAATGPAAVGTPAAGAGSADPAAAASVTGAAAAASVVSIPVTIVVSGDYFQTVAFLKQLQTKMPRAFLVTTIQMAASSGTATSSSGSATSGQVLVTVTGSVFALPGMSAESTTTGSAAGADVAKSPMGGGATSAPSTPVTAPAVAPSAGAGATATASPSATPTREDS